MESANSINENKYRFVKKRYFGVYLPYYLSFFLLWVVVIICILAFLGTTSNTLIIVTIHTAVFLFNLTVNYIRGKKNAAHDYVNYQEEKGAAIITVLLNKPRQENEYTIHKINLLNKDTSTLLLMVR